MRRPSTHRPSSLSDLPVLGPRQPSAQTVMFDLSLETPRPTTGERPREMDPRTARVRSVLGAAGSQQLAHRTAPGPSTAASRPAHRTIRFETGTATPVSRRGRTTHARFIPPDRRRHHLSRRVSCPTALTPFGCSQNRAESHCARPPHLNAHNPHGRRDVPRAQVSPKRFVPQIPTAKVYEIQKGHDTPHASSPGCGTYPGQMCRGELAGCQLDRMSVIGWQ
jgi:hypothetical protein